MSSEFNQAGFDGSYNCGQDGSKGQEGMFPQYPYPAFNPAQNIPTSTLTSPYFPTAGYSQPSHFTNQNSLPMYNHMTASYQAQSFPHYSQASFAPPANVAENSNLWSTGAHMQHHSEVVDVNNYTPVPTQTTHVPLPNVKPSSPPQPINKRLPQKVKFFLKGTLGPDMNKFIKSVKQILVEPVDFEEQFYENFISNGQTSMNDLAYKGVEKIEDSQSFNDISNIEDSQVHVNETTQLPSMQTAFPTPLMVSTPANPKSAYMEPSLAQIRASVRLLDTEQRLKGEFGDMELRDNDVVVKEESIDTIDENDVINENWYATAMKSYMDTTTTRLENADYSTCAIKGGRSDPDNPFAITSPSFSDSAAKAVLTTMQSGTATIVMVSVMSIGSREQLIPKVVNSKAAEGGIIHIVNPIESPGSKMTQTENGSAKLESQTTSIMSKLQRSRSLSESKEEINKDTKIDRLDINIRIEDDQYVDSGDSKRWKCKLCDKSYTTKHNLVTHILDHSGIKPHLCLVCGKYFKQLSHLNVHMLTHDNVRPHVCPICNKGFTQVSHLKRHEAVHTGSKPYTCDVCGRGFAFPSELRIHKVSRKGAPGSTLSK